MRLLRASEVAQRLCVSLGQVYALCKSGELPSRRIGHSVRVDEEDLSAYLEERKRRGAYPDEPRR